MSLNLLADFLRVMFSHDQLLTSKYTKQLFTRFLILLQTICNYKTI